MGLKDEVKDMKSELEEIKSESLAMELLKDYKKSNKRMFVIIIILILGLIGSNAYWIYEYTHTTIEDTIEYANTDDGGNACVGDNCNNGEIDYGEGLQEN